MRAIRAWFRLWRPLNVALVALTPPAVWASLVRPLPSEPELTLGQIGLVGIAVALVAAGGNVVNDIADRTIDQLNGRRNPLVDDLSLGTAWTTYAGFTAAAALLTWQLAVELDRVAYAGLLPASVVALLAYAFALKCTPWLGNATVAAFCAGVPGIVALAEPTVVLESRSLLSQSLFAYVCFAFFGTWARELVKDLQDRAGDRAAGCATLAVRWEERSVVTLVALALFATLAITAWLSASWGLAGEWTSAFAWGALWLLQAGIVGQLGTRDDLATDYASVSRNLKLAVIFGLALLLLGGARGGI